MKFTVDISDSWIETDEDNQLSLEKELKREIIYQVKSQIMASIKDQIAKEITAVVKTEMEETLKVKIEATTSALIQSGKITIGSQEVPLAEHLKNQFNSHTSWNNPVDTLRKLAAQFGNELKARYDVAFANQIVIKIKEQGMLKDDVVQMLLNKD